jgi:tRNA pseudouridine13 synthase
VTIRKQPTDFIVREAVNQALLNLMQPRWSSECPYAAYELTKTSLTTPAATGMLAQQLGMRVGDVQYAGLKDKHAMTTQMVTAHVRREKQESLGADSLPLELTHQGMSARRLGYLPQAIKAGDIAHNQFQIDVRDLSRQAWEVLDHRQRLLRLIPCAPGKREADLLRAHLPESGLLVPNYFGDQRFASVRRGQFAAKHLIHGDFEAALKVLIASPLRKESGASKTASRLCAQHWGNWPRLLSLLNKSPARGVVTVLKSGGTFREAFEALPHLDRQMAVESLQSHLWNATAARIIRQHCARGWTEASATGELAFPFAVDVPDHLRAARVPMASPSLAPDGPDADLWRDALHATLDAEELSLDQLAIPGIRRPSFDAFDRPLFVEARQFGCSAPNGDPRIDVRIEFHLPSGAYATNVLRAMGQ